MSTLFLVSSNKSAGLKFTFRHNSLFLADVVTPEEQEQVFAANVHNLCKMAGMLLQECAEN